MTASCNGTITSWLWWKNGVAWSPRGAISPVTQTDALPANTTTAAVGYTYSASACNGGLCAWPPITTTFTVAAAAGGGGPGGGGVGTQCSGYTKTTYVNIPWNNTGNMYPNPQMDANDVVVGVLTTPAAVSPTPANGLGQLAIAEYGGGSGAARYITVSTSPCDWKPVDFVSSYYTGSPNIQFSFGANVGAMTLQTNTTYFVNIKNWGPAGQAPGCSSTLDCGISLYWGKPSGS